jgi:putative zinc finger protein
MNHSEAVEQMTAERYLLNELTPDARDAFEEHVFDCPECALDLRAGALFVREAKVQLPDFVASHPRSGMAKARGKRTSWFSWWRPAFAVPAFAALLIVVGYQNFVTFPALRQSANEPRLAPLAPLRSATRGATRPTFTADRTHGVALPVDLVIEPEMAPAASYSFDLRGPQGKLVWTGSLPATAPGADSDQLFSLDIPGGMLQSGPYSLMVTGVTTQGGRTPIEQYNFDIVMTN